MFSCLSCRNPFLFSTVVVDRFFVTNVHPDFKPFSVRESYSLRSIFLARIISVNVRSVSQHCFSGACRTRVQRWFLSDLFSLRHL